MERRKFLQQAAATAALAGWKAAAGQSANGNTELTGAAALTPLPVVNTSNGIGRRKLGRADVEVSIIGIGGYHIGLSDVTEQEALRVVRAALDQGINFLDNCWDYNGGVSEERMGKALSDGYRKKAFLMTKIDGRTGAAARQQLEQSLTRLKTDHIDLVQIHEVIRLGDPEQAFQPGNVVEVLQQARKEGKIRFIGFTGHKSPKIHLHMIETADKHGFTFDTVQMPVNALDEHYDSFGQNVIPRSAKARHGGAGDEAAEQWRDSEDRHHHRSRGAALRDERACDDDDYRLPIDGEPGTSSGSGAKLQADGCRAENRCARKDRAGRG